MHFMRKNIFTFLVYIFFTSSIICQPDSRFRPFDWVLYRGPGVITSLSEGYSNLYIGTNLGGIFRFNLFSNNFLDPITVAQGLKNNDVSAVYFDHTTGILWAATRDHLEFSYTREGDWNSIAIQDIGLSRFDKIRRIGSSKNYIWVQGNSVSVKLEHSSGTVVGIFPYPDEMKIIWSSGNYQLDRSLDDILSSYSIMSGWYMSGNQLIDPIGRNVNITTALRGRHGDIWVGSDNGTLLHGKSISEVFYPITIGPYGKDTGGLMIFDNYLWYGGIDYVTGKGVSWMNLNSNETFTFEFDKVINMYPTPVFSFWDTQESTWVGGEELILIYDKKENYWRTLGAEKGIPNGRILDISGDSTYIWIASSSGICRLNIKSWKEETVGFEYLFKNIPVHDILQIDENVWIGSGSGVFVYNNTQPQIRNAQEIGNKEFAERIYNVRSLSEYGESIYVSCEIGIVKFDRKDLVWTLLFPSAYYHSKIVNDMIVNKKFIFLGTKDGIVRITKKTGFIREYYFPFIGNVNNIGIDRNIIWMGTSNGLLKFKWTREQ